MQYSKFIVLKVFIRIAKLFSLQVSFFSWNIIILKKGVIDLVRTQNSPKN